MLKRKKYWALLSESVRLLPPVEKKLKEDRYDSPT